MQIALLQTTTYGFDVQANVQSIIQNLAAVPEADVCVCSANALCALEISEYPFPAQCTALISDAIKVLASQCRHGQTLVLTIPRINEAGSVDLCVLSICNGAWKFASSSMQQVEGVRIFWATMQIQGQKFGFCLFAHRTLPKIAADFFKEHQCEAVFLLAAKAWVWQGASEDEQQLCSLALELNKPCFLLNAIGVRETTLYGGESFVASVDGVDLRMPAFVEGAQIWGKQHISQPRSSSLASLWQALVFGTKFFVLRSGCQNVWLGLSGGIDSALVVAIAKEALGEGVHALIMPSPYNSEESMEDAKQLAENLGVHYCVLPIVKAMETFEQLLLPMLPTPQACDLTFENLQARIRAVLLFAFANRAHALVLNTSNLSEIAQGYSTLYGDSTGALAVIGDLFKGDVYALSNWYNQTHPQAPIPERILQRAPSAELRPNQKDSDTLPDYPILDKVLRAILQGQFPQEEVAVQIWKRLCRTEFKRRQCPAALRVRTKSFTYGFHLPLF